MEGYYFDAGIIKEQAEGHCLTVQEKRLKDYAYRKNLTVLKIYQIIEASTQDNRKSFKQVLHPTII